ncbi:MAG: acylphosphatase [Thermoproteota archaeon]
MLKRRIVIRGERVQDVGYRLFLLEAAESLGLKGFQARNVNDYVEFLAEGEEEPVTRFVDFAKKNYPEPATVKEVVEEPYEGNVMSLEGFYRSFSLNQLVEIVNVGVSMLGKQDKMLEKQDSVLEKQDLMLEKQDQLLGKMDTMIEKQDLMLGKQDAVLNKMSLMLEKQDVLIDEVRSLRNDLKAYG